MKSLKIIENISSWEYLERHENCWSDTRFPNANISNEEGAYEGGLWGCDDLVDSVRKHDQAYECINGRDNVKIKWEERKVPRSNTKPKQKIKLTKLKRTQKVRGLEKIGFDPKRGEEFEGIVG